MSKKLAPLLAGREQIRTQPTVYECAEDGNIDGWLFLMKRFLERVHTNITTPNRELCAFQELGKIGFCDYQSVFSRNEEKVNFKVPPI